MRKSRENGLFLNVPDEQWNDWKWQVENRIETLEDLKKYITLTEEEEEGIKATLGRLRMAITPYYLSLIDLNDPYDPIRKQAIPTEHELEFAPYEDADPLHEDIDSPCPGLTHRYPDRVLRCKSGKGFYVLYRMAGSHITLPLTNEFLIPAKKSAIRRSENGENHRSLHVGRWKANRLYYAAVPRDAKSGPGHPQPQVYPRGQSAI